MSGYGDDAGFDAWLAAEGYSLPVGAPSRAVLRQRGSNYVDGTYQRRFPGVPTGGAMQDRQWPRTGAQDRYGNDIAPGAIPQRVIDASYQAAYIEASSPGALFTTYTPGQTKVLTKVDTIQWTLVAPNSADKAMVLVSTAIEGLLSPLLVRADVPAILVV